jgi:hypothetical protein
MKQAFHIFLKDARYLWVEIVLSLVVTAAFAVEYPDTWLWPDSILEHGGLHQKLIYLARTLTVLVPLSWWLLIGRVVHAETLIGDRQFWVTKPYDWRSLLGAKLLFIAVFIYLPFLVSQWVLLVEAGFWPLSYLGGIGFNLALVTGALIVPLLAIAAVTLNFGRMTLAILAIVAYIAGVAYLDSTFGSPSVFAPYSDRYSIPALLIVLLTVIVLQYARRRTLLARLLLASAAVAITVVAVTLPTQGMVDTAYPLPGDTWESPLLLTSLVDVEHGLKASESDSAHEVEMLIPIGGSGVAPGFAVTIDDVKATLDGANGVHVELPWQAVYNYQFLPGEYNASLPFKMKRADFERLQSSAVKITLWFALTEMRAGKTTTRDLAKENLSGRGSGLCPTGIWTGKTGTGEGECLVALRQPDLTYIKVSDSSGSCANLEDNSFAQGWVGGLDNDPAELSLTPVLTTSVYLKNSRDQPVQPQCSGGSVSLTPYHAARRVRTQLKLPEIRLIKEENSVSKLLILPK